MGKVRLIYSLFLTVFLLSCGTAVAPASKKTSAASTTNFYVSSFNPSSGSVTSPPTTITVTFNVSALTENTANAVSNYNIICGSNYVASDSVARTVGTFTTVVTLPAITGLSSGTVCTFIVSTNIKDDKGVSLGGSNTATYTIQ